MKRIFYSVEDYLNAHGIRYKKVKTQSNYEYKIFGLPPMRIKETTAKKMFKIKNRNKWMNKKKSRGSKKSDKNTTSVPSEK